LSTGATASATGFRYASLIRSDAHRASTMKSPREDHADASGRHLGSSKHGAFTSEPLLGKRKKRQRVVHAIAIVLLLRFVQTSYIAADETTRALAHVHYQAPAILVLALWLWGGNLFAWHARGFDPHPLVVFQPDDGRAHLTHSQVWGIAHKCTLLYLTSAAAFLVFANRATARDRATAHLCAAGTYVSAIAALMFPGHRLYPRTRARLRRTILRCLTPWRRPVTFGDFFFADILCSLAKTLSDAERSMCAAAAGPSATFDRRRDARFGVCGSTSLRVPVLLALPSLIRLTQCLRQRRDGMSKSSRGDSDPRLLKETHSEARTASLNALKYLSAFPVVFLSHLKYSVSNRLWTAFVRPCWIACAALNTAYSFYWDVTHDWGLEMIRSAARRARRFVWGSVGGRLEESSGEKRFDGGVGDAPNGDSERATSRDETRAATSFRVKYLRPSLLYGDSRIYVVAVVLDFFLRLSWTYKLSSHLRHNAGSVFAFTAMEITRRFLWSMFRIEKAYLARVGTGNLPR